MKAHQSALFHPQWPLRAPHHARQDLRCLVPHLFAVVVCIKVLYSIMLVFLHEIVHTSTLFVQNDTLYILRSFTQHTTRTMRRKTVSERQPLKSFSSMSRRIFSMSSLAIDRDHSPGCGDKVTIHQSDTKITESTSVCKKVANKHTKRTLHQSTLYTTSNNSTHTYNKVRTLKKAIQACGVRRRRWMQILKNSRISDFSFFAVRASSRHPIKNLPNICTYK